MSKRDRTPVDQVSELTTARLSVYLRSLEELEREGVRTVSSERFAELFRLNAAQIRKDLAQFGEFGVRGVGYYVPALRQQLRQILGLERVLKMGIVGAGNLGLALADYPGFRQHGFEVVALFDVARGKVGHASRSGVPIRAMRDLRRVVERERIDIAVLAVPVQAAQVVLEQVIDVGIRAVLNFTPAALRVPEAVKLKHVDLTVSLESLSFFLARDGQDHGEG